jgi:hypothetical protein
MLRTATKITKLFNRDESGHYPFWRLKVMILHTFFVFFLCSETKYLNFKTPEEFEAENQIKSKEARKYIFNCLEDMAHVNVPTDLEGVELIAEKLDRRAFVGILKEMLQLDQERRIEPDTALKDTFLTMNHLVDYAHLNNVRMSFQMMEVSYKKTRMSDPHAAANALMSNAFMPSSNNNNMALAFNNGSTVPFNTQVRSDPIRYPAVDSQTRKITEFQLNQNLQAATRELAYVPCHIQAGPYFTGARNQMPATLSIFPAYQSGKHGFRHDQV